MWVTRNDYACPACGECCVEQFVVTDEAWTEYIVGERHECGWENIRMPELKGLMDENSSRNPS